MVKALKYVSNSVLMFIFGVIGSLIFFYWSYGFLTNGLNGVIQQLINNLSNI